MTNDPFRTPGEQDEPPNGLCETCVHMSKSHSGSPPEHWRCNLGVREAPVDAELRFVSSKLNKPKMTDPRWCSCIRKECGAVCLGYSEKQP